MEQDGFSGLNPSKAKNDIEIFEGAGMQVYNIIKDANVKFVTDMSSHWWSRRAVDFAEQNLPIMADAQNSIYRFINNTVVKAVNAYNSLASNNTDHISTDRSAMVEGQLPNDTPEVFQVGGAGGQTAFKEIGPSGKVGMYVDDVNATYLPELTTTITNAINTYLDNIPDTISFYDPSGEIALAYKNGIAEGKSKLDTELKSIYDSINAVVESEINLSKEEAANAASDMSGGKAA